ncbi:MAG: peptide chain release factor N(5)-glutamine methyltransferase [Synechococcales bacterium]|nr:peptide chain release factor N(5)-glutamine methyltransferase [Synechococcales bacterium]
MTHAVSGEQLWEWWQAARQRAIAHTVPPFELDWFLQALSDLDRLALRLETFRHRPAVQIQVPLDELERRWQQRLVGRSPVQYLVGTAPWRQFSLIVSPAVLIPRPETERIIDWAIAATADHPDQRMGHWADLGTGSGAIALGLATAFPQAMIHAVDCSGEALVVARQNAAAHGLGDRIQFYQGSWFAPLNHLAGDLRGMVSNPPYIPSSEVNSLQPEVAHHEPHLALNGGLDGLDAIRHLVKAAPDYLQPGGVWLVEIMAGQAQAVTQLLSTHGAYQDIRVHLDLAGVERFVRAYRRS